MCVYDHSDSCCGCVYVDSHRDYHCKPGMLRLVELEERGSRLLEELLHGLLDSVQGIIDLGIHSGSERCRV